MNDFLIHLLSHGRKLPEGTAQVALNYEGLSPGWAFFAALLLAAGVAALYWRPSVSLSAGKRFLLTAVRALLFACFLVLLMRPVLFLTIEQPVRRTLLVLLDVSRSMNLKDTRLQGDDLKRSALAAGALDPAKGIGQNAPADAKAFAGLSRLDLLRALAANGKMNFWPRLHEKANLAVFGFGKGLMDLGALGADSPDPDGIKKLSLDDTTAFFKRVEATEGTTAMGDALRALLDAKRGQSIAGVLLVTDGANNSGVAPLQAADLAARDRVPLYVYGVGITTPLDIIVSQISGPTTIPVKEKAIFTVKVKGLGLAGKKATLILKADGRQVDQKEVAFGDGAEQEVEVSYVPPKIGAAALEASIAPVEGEAMVTNNSANIHVRVTDEKERLLVIEQEPRWDFVTLFAMMGRDRRLAPKAIVLDGDADLSNAPDSLFLPRTALPASQDDLAVYQIVVLGDVDPARLGTERMKVLADWVEKGGGSLLFLAGPKFNPGAYKGTPLEPLFPVELTGDGKSEHYAEPVKLKRTPAGEFSPLLSLADVAGEDAAIWDGFPGVSWTARVGRPRPSAQALLVDPTADRANRDGAMPVIAQQNYGSGQTLYIGMQETYRWRSKVGEKYYTRIWGQILQSLNPEKNASGLGKVRLRSDRVRYETGDRIVISGTILDATGPISGTLTVQPTGGATQAPPQQIELKLLPVPDRPSEFRGEATARFAGSCTFTVPQAPDAPVTFDVEEPNLEQSETAMDAKLLQAMAKAAGGRFLREEDLNGLPDQLVSAADPAPTFQKIELVFTPWILIFMIGLATLEWVVRRLSHLK
jgi:uncharacterized membrane protein